MTTTGLKVGKTYSGFILDSISPLPELNITLYQLHHDKTGARMVHLEADDDNNLFGVGFHTTPTDSTGVAHILEHTVLCGSKHYPVRDPFFSMIKRSLNTFMNALTSSDWTLYPFSSQNEKDFYNLLGIYLDAAFFPLLRERDFHQEGHRLEFSQPDDPESALEYKGVVFNEMKGAMADPSSLLGRTLNKALYPTTTYGYNSGGEPEEIPTLTHQQLKDFHATSYHPANAYIYTYGNFSLEKHLRTIDELALSHFESKEVDTSVPDEQRYDTPRRVTETFPVDPGEPLEQRSMAQTAWLTCPAADNFDRVALSVLSTLLLGNPAAPLYNALLESRFGQNLAPGSGYHEDNRETFFAVGLQGTDPDKAEAIEQLILETLEKCAVEGFAAERVEAAMQQMEFGHREVSGDQFPYPLLLLMRLFGPWIHSGDPVSPLQLSEDLERIRAEVEAGPFFENLIREQLLDNPHRVTLTLKPDPKKKERQNKVFAERLAQIKAGLDEDAKRRIIEQARELQQAQEAEEDLSCLPSLQFSDIPVDERPVSWSVSEEGGINTYWFEQPTNGIVYFNGQIESSALSDELRRHLPMFGALLPQIGAAGYSYLEMAQRISAATGGIRANSMIIEDPDGLDRVRTVLEVRGKALVRNREKLFGILGDIFQAPDFDDLQRLHTVINQMRISLENSIPGSGHSYAARHAASSLSAGAALREEWSGISQLRLIRSYADKPAEELADLSQTLKEVARTLLGRASLNCAITAEKKTMSDSAEPLRRFLGQIPQGRDMGDGAKSSFEPHPISRGLATSVPVSYVSRVFRTVPYTHPDAAAFLVLAKLLRSGFLHREIREKGGAYGGLAGYDIEGGIFSMLSYRDPQLTRTLEVYRQAVEWAADGRFSDEELKEAILSAFSDLDRPLSPGGRGNREFGNIRQGLTIEKRQRQRERLLNVDRHTLQNVARKYLLEGWENSSVGIVSGEEALKKANEEQDEIKLDVEKI